MNFRVGILFVLTLYGSSVHSSENNISRPVWVDELIRHENENIGTKIGLAGKAASVYKDYVQSVMDGKSEDAAKEWVRFQQYCFRFNNSKPPYTQHVLSGGFGYWLYRRLAYPVNKNNWGFLKKNMARLIIPAFLFKGICFSNYDLEDCINARNRYQDRNFEQLKEHYVQLDSEKQRLDVELNAQIVKYKKEKEKSQALYEAKLKAQEQEYKKEKEESRALYDAKLKAQEQEYETKLWTEKALCEQKYEKSIKNCFSMTDQQKAGWKALAEKYKKQLGY